jgi:FHIPEP family
MPMHDDHARISPPEVILSLSVDPGLGPVASTGDPLNEAVRREIALKLAGILDTLGIPGEPVVQIGFLGEDTPSTGKFLRVAVYNQVCRYPDELLQRVHSYVRGVPMESGATPTQILTWLRGLCAEPGGTSGAEGMELVEFLSLTCLEVIKRRPAVLLGPSQAAAYRNSLPDPTDGPGSQPGAASLDLPWLATLLRAALDLRISIADKQTVAKVLTEEMAKGRPREDVVEELIAALRPDTVEIQFPQAYLRQLTTTESDGGRDRFALMRDGLFYELGLRYPKFEFVPVEGLKPNGFRFKINHLTTLPRVGLRPGEHLVNDTPDRLRLLNIHGRATINPANWNDCSLIDLDARDAASSAGLTTWNPIEYLVLCFSADLRENSACFLDQRAVQTHLSQLEQAFPALVKAVQAKVSIERLTRVLRSLIAEELSIRNLRLLLEWTLDYDYIVTDPSRFIIFDDRVPVYEMPDQVQPNDATTLTAFVRTGMKRYISHKYTRGRSTLVVYLIDPEIEKALSGHRASELGERGRTPPVETVRDRTLEAAREELQGLPLSSTPAVLTTVEVRSALRDLLAPEFPRVPVLAYQELSPDLNIQPVARISWTRRVAQKPGGPQARP